MVRLREIPRTAAFAWSPPGVKPLMVTGTRSGAVDADFSGDTKLELWDLDLDSTGQGLELQPMVSIATESRFFDLAWAPPTPGRPRGIIAGALENGALEIYDPERLVAGQDALISRATKHSGPIKSLQFNPLKPQILASAGAKGELFVWDVNDIETPFRLGNPAARADDIDCLAWNCKVGNILATGGAGGFVTVWDLKTKKASLILNNNRKPVSALAWDPTNSTSLMTATSDDNTPVIMLWNLRNSQAPERTLQGHEQGVLSLSWCQQDPSIMISCAKDNRTRIWNPRTGELYGGFPEATNWTFFTRFNPANPNMLATASFDGKITVQTLQHTNPDAAPVTQGSLDDGDDFFSKAPTQLQAASFSLPKAPSWLERPVGASFGFGGKLVIVSKDDSPAGQPRSSKIRISRFSVDSDVGSTTERFEQALQNGDLGAICEAHMEQAKDEEEKAEWQIMQTLNESDGRARIIEYLGFPKEGDLDGAEELGSPQPDKEPEIPASAPLDVKEAGKKHRRAISAWGEAGDDEDFLFTANKGAKTDDPFHLLSDGNTALEDQVTKALILGQFEKATDICLKEDRIADAFIIANCGSKNLVEKVQKAYLAKKKGSPSYLRLINAVVAKNLWDVAYNADLVNWKETMVTLCTYGDPSEFPDLCEALGDRVFESGSRKDALFCYLVGSKLEKAVGIWLSELEESEKEGMKASTDDSTFSVHARSLQLFIEKVTVFRHVTKFTDSETGLQEGWKLSALYDKYVEYADIAAAQGQLGIAQRYLDFLPSSYPAADVARSRIMLATQKAAPRAGARVEAPSTRTQPRVSATTTGYPQPAPARSPLNPYAAPMANIANAPQVQQPPANPYMPRSGSPYVPAGAAAPAAPSANTSYLPQQVSFANPQTSTGNFPPLSSFGPPPRAGQQAAPPPPRASKDAGDWNDLPTNMVAKPPPRKTTPRVGVSAPSPFAVSAPSPTGPFQRSVATPPPPPPKGSAPPRTMVSPPTGPAPIGGPPQSGQRSVSAASNPYAPPPQAASNPYAPPPQATHIPTAGMMPRTVSPYNVPPAGAPPSNRYLPSPAAAQQYSQPPPPGVMAPPPAYAYAPAPTPSGPGMAQYAAPPQGRTPMAPPPMARPPGGPPPPPSSSVGPPPSARPPPAAAGASATPPPPQGGKVRLAPGDRSNIPEAAREMVALLERDMQRVAGKAPATFAPQVKDTQKRLGLLFDALNNHELVQPDTVARLAELASALAGGDYDTAARLQADIQREKAAECGHWMLGVKRLITMSKATP